MTILRDAQGVAHLVGLSGGKDSVCMALMLREREPRPYTYVYTPTGDELPAMVAHMKRVEQLLGSHLLVITNGTLASLCEQTRMIPNHRMRSCTRILKLKPFGRLVEEAAPAVCYVGLRADEDEREGTRPGGDSAAIGTDAQQDFPLRRWGVTLADVWKFLNERDVAIPQRTDCARCPFQTLGEWYLLWRDHREVYLSAENDEARYGHTYRSPSGKHGPWPHDLKNLRAEFEKGRIPERSLNMMDKRKGMCRACSL